MFGPHALRLGEDDLLQFLVATVNGCEDLQLVRDLLAGAEPGEAVRSEAQIEGLTLPMGLVREVRTAPSNKPPISASPLTFGPDAGGDTGSGTAGGAEGGRLAVVHPGPQDPARRRVTLDRHVGRDSELQGRDPHDLAATKR